MKPLHPTASPGTPMTVIALSYGRAMAVQFHTMTTHVSHMTAPRNHGSPTAVTFQCLQEAP